jgi:hypothetical protein
VTQHVHSGSSEQPFADVVVEQQEALLHTAFLFVVVIVAVAAVAAAVVVVSVSVLIVAAVF